MVLLSALQVTLAEIEGIFRGLLVQHTPGLMEAAAGAGSEAGLAVLDGGVVPQPDFPELPSLSPLEYQSKKVLFGCSWRDLDGCSGVMRSLICLRAPVLLQLLWR